MTDNYHGILSSDTGPHSTVFYIPTQSGRLADLFSGFAGIKIDSVMLYDLAMFVDAFMLSDRVFVEYFSFDLLIPTASTYRGTNLRGIFEVVRPLLPGNSQVISSAKEKASVDAVGKSHSAGDVFNDSELAQEKRQLEALVESLGERYRAWLNNVLEYASEVTPDLQQRPMKGGWRGSNRRLVRIGSEILSKISANLNSVEEAPNLVQMKKHGELSSAVLSIQKEEIRLLNEYHPALCKIEDLLETDALIGKLAHNSYYEQSMDIAESIHDFGATEFGQYLKNANIEKLCLRYGMSLFPGVGYLNALTAPASRQVDGLYRAVCDKFHADLKKAELYFGKKYIYLPPFMAILLSRCSRIDDIWDKLYEMRSEFSELRDIRRHRQMEEASVDTLGQLIELAEDAEAEERILVSRMSKKQSKVVVRKVWDVVRTASILGALGKVGDIVYDWSEEKKHLSNVKAYIDVYDYVKDVRDYATNIEKCFGRQIDYLSFERLAAIAPDIC